MNSENVKMWVYIRFISLILGLRDIKCENSKVKNSLQLPDSKVFPVYLLNLNLKL